MLDSAKKMRVPFLSGLLFGLATLAQAHFVFVIPNADGTSATVILNETLTPTAQVDVGIIDQTKLSVRNADGQEIPLTLEKGDRAYSVKLPDGNGVRIIHGLTDLGMLEHGQNKPSVLLYHPKAIVGDAFARPQILGGDTPVELVPLGKPGAVSLELLVHGKPQGNAEITVVLPDNSQKKLKTNEQGQTEPLTQTGQLGAWARYWEPLGGERDGKRFDETRHYATLVFQAGAASNEKQAPAINITAKRFATLPEPTSSFGEVVSDGWLYVYGGHIAHTHSYSTNAVSGRFERLNLTDGKTWEFLPSGPGLQGMNLALYAGKIYRIGGMEPRNKPGEKQATFSVADCARFDPATKTWSALPPLPDPRSSHDVVVIGSKLLVVGGWNLKGAEGQKWADTLDVMDLSDESPKWTTINQPFKRRALMAAAYEGKLYVVGGFDDKGEILHTVSIFDPETNAWTTGPDLPGGETNGFSPAVCVNDGVLYVSVADGTLYRLDKLKQTWVALGRSTPRLAHRIGFWNETILISGGADKGNNFDLVEAISLHDQQPQ
jgi:hypothetical protein